jgi:quercetin dioxygenase-like cupin family protein
MAHYIYIENDQGDHQITLSNLSEQSWENGPGAFKGIGGTVIGDATRLMLMKFESKSETPFHRVVSGISIILQGVLTVRHSKSEDLLLHPGDSIAVSFSIDSKWKLINGGTTEVLLALVKMK